MRNPVPIALVFLFAPLGCTGAPQDADDQRIAHRPFTAHEIRSAHPSGLNKRYRVERPGKPEGFSAFRVVGVSNTGLQFEQQVVDASGHGLADAVVQTTTWTELQNHATFPEAATTIEDVSIETPIGTHSCWRYTIVEGRTVNTFCFDKKLPGAPVRFVLEIDGAPQQTVTLIAIEDPRR